MTSIKICGLKRLIDVEYVNKYGPDYVGFVFAGKKRNLTDEMARELKNHLRNDIKAVGVFVNEPMEHIVSLCKDSTIDLVQLHGDESNEYINHLKQQVNSPIIKAIRVKEEEDIKTANEFTCDYLLLDSFQEDSYGGSGKTFDWSMIKNLNKPFFLAGGINKENVEKAMQIAHPFGIDVSSSVETQGFKDEEKIYEIIELVRKGNE